MSYRATLRLASSLVWLGTMGWVWSTFWLEDLHRSRTEGVLVVIPAVALVFAVWPGRDRLARTALGAAVGLVPVWVFFVIRDVQEGYSCSWGPSESYERAISWTFVAFVLWGVSSVHAVKRRAARDRWQIDP